MASTPAFRSSRIQLQLQQREINNKQTSATLALPGIHKAKVNEPTSPEFSSDEDEDEDVPILQSEIEPDEQQNSSDIDVSLSSHVVMTQENEDYAESREESVDETEGSYGEDRNSLTPPVIESELQQRHDQLQGDIDVLVAHLEKQTLEMDTERAAMHSVQQHLYHTVHATEKELQHVRQEPEILRHQHADLLKERDVLAQQAITATTTHDELLFALHSQQQREEQARVIVMNLLKERDILHKQLDESKVYSRRLEEEVVTTRAESQRLESDNTTLQAVAKAATTMKNDREIKLLAEQSSVIESLRQDLVQMEFEYKTVVVDKETLCARVLTLERTVAQQQQQHRHHGYDVISLTGDNEKKKKRHSLSIPTSSNANLSSRSSSNLDGFTNLMSLPNCISDHPESIAASRGGGSISPVAKTTSSAKKKLFSSSTPHHTVVLPQ